MQAAPASSSHHLVRAKPLKLNHIPMETIEEVISYLPTLEMSRMMRVCRGLNRVLNSNASLWRWVDLNGTWHVTSGKVIPAIKICSDRSRNTLESIRVSEYWDNNHRLDRLYSLLQRSESTLRRIDLDLECYQESSRYEVILRSLITFPNLERLNLTSESIPEARVQEQISGNKLTVLVVGRLITSHRSYWTQQDFDRLSSLRIFYALNCNFEFMIGKNPLFSILQACSSTLTHFSNQIYADAFFKDSDTGKRVDWHNIEPDFPNLTNLSLGKDGIHLYCDPPIKHIEGVPERILGYMDKSFESISFIIEQDEYDFYDTEEDPRQTNLSRFIRVCRASSSTVLQMKFRQGYESGYPIDRLLDALMIHEEDDEQDEGDDDDGDGEEKDSSILCPLLSDLFVGGTQNYFDSTLVVLVFSRNQRNKSIEKDRESESCSSLTLHLSPERIKGFRKAEEEYLSIWLDVTGEVVETCKVEEWK